MRKSLLGLVILLALVVAGVWFIPSYLNSYPTCGEAFLPGLKSEVTVTRDENGMAYIRAQEFMDAIFVQGFVTAQDRLFQMETARLAAQGRLAELTGEAARRSDITNRTIGFYRLGRRHAEMLDPESRAFFQRYVDGVNAFIERRPGEVHLEFRLAGIEPEIWTVADSLSLLYLISWQSSANLKAEVITQMLVDKLGWEKAQEIFPVNINPDDPNEDQVASPAPKLTVAQLNLSHDESLANLLGPASHHLGSNNWTVSPRFSPGEKPILAGDPHLDARILPGVWYPLAIITPEIRAVGVNLAGVPGMAFGRTNHIALALTNAYPDVQDLYVETVDPDRPGHYLEAGVSRPFEVTSETLKIKDPNALGGSREEEIRIQATKRGPVISGVLEGLETDKVLALRWAAAETMQPNLPLRELLTARTVGEVHQIINRFSMMTFNFVFADEEGSIGWRVGGRIPIRVPGHGTVPSVVEDGSDDWVGWIPFEEVPHVTNPERGWIGTSNQKMISSDYPYYYSNYFATSYRYRRQIELLDSPEPKSVDDHWRFQRDAKNLMAEDLAPIMATALLGQTDTQELGQILEDWNFVDDAESVAPTIFQAVYRKLAERVFSDELGPKLTRATLAEWYFWQERFQKMVMKGDSPWFDDVSTEGRESLEDLLHLAALEAAEELQLEVGGPPQEWLWGKVHQIDFVNVLRRNGWGKSLMGGRSFPMSGSGETLYRARYDFHDPASVTFSASLRMVVDLGDPDKILAVLPGGTVGRTFHPHFNDQLDPYMTGEKLYWWFSDQAIEEHTASKLVLNVPPQ